MDSCLCGEFLPHAVHGLPPTELLHLGGGDLSLPLSFTKPVFTYSITTPGFCSLAIWMWIHLLTSVNSIYILTRSPKEWEWCEFNSYLGLVVRALTCKKKKKKDHFLPTRFFLNCAKKEERFLLQITEGERWKLFDISFPLIQEPKNEKLKWLLNLFCAIFLTVLLDMLGFL